MVDEWWILAILTLSAIKIITQSTCTYRLKKQNTVELTRLTAALGKAALRYISYRFNWSSEKLETSTLQISHQDSFTQPNTWRKITGFSSLLSFINFMTKWDTARLVTLMQNSLNWIYIISERHYLIYTNLVDAEEFTYCILSRSFSWISFLLLFTFVPSPASSVTVLCDASAISTATKHVTWSNTQQIACRETAGS